MKRTISVIRRRANLVDMLVPRVAGTGTYRIKWAANFDGVFASIIDATTSGFFDDSISRNKVELQPTQDQIRIVFDPATFSIPDGQHIWIQLFTVPFGGVEAQASAATLLLPESAHHGVGTVTIHGNAPNGASTANSLQIDLPRLMQNINIHSEEPGGGNNLFVSTEEGGPEQQLRPDTFPQEQNFLATQSSLWVRGGGGVVAFSVTCTLGFPRLEAHMTEEELAAEKDFATWYYRSDGTNPIAGEEAVCAEAGFVAGWKAAKGLLESYSPPPPPPPIPVADKLSKGFRAQCGCTLTQAPMDYLGTDEREAQETLLKDEELPLYFVCILRAGGCVLHPAYHLYRMEAKELIGLLLPDVGTLPIVLLLMQGIERRD